jgi:hypothetical protein
MQITTTLRQYFNTTAQELEDNRDLFNLVEALIDNYVGEKLINRITSKANQLKRVYEEPDFTIANNQITLVNEDQDYWQKNTFQFCIVEVLEGQNKGLFPIVKSEDNVLTLATNNSPLFTAFEVYQLGNFPRMADYNRGYKKIPQEIQQACFYLAKYLLENKEVLESVTFQSETQSTGSYSYSLADGSKDLTMPVYITRVLDKFKY